MSNVLVKEIKLGASTLKLETGRMAKLADGAVLGKYGDSVVLATAAVAKKPVAKKAAVAKKPVAKKVAVAKKPVAKKATVAKKPVAKKAAAKKTTKK